MQNENEPKKIDETTKIVETIQPKQDEVAKTENIEHIETIIVEKPVEKIINKIDILNNIISGKFLGMLSHCESIESQKDKELKLVESSMKGFQGINLYLIHKKYFLSLYLYLLYLLVKIDEYDKIIKSIPIPKIEEKKLNNNASTRSLANTSRLTTSKSVKRIEPPKTTTANSKLTSSRSVKRIEPVKNTRNISQDRKSTTTVTSTKTTTLVNQKSNKELVTVNNNRRNTPVNQTVALKRPNKDLNMEKLNLTNMSNPNEPSNIPNTTRGSKPVNSTFNSVKQNLNKKFSDKDLHNSIKNTSINSKNYNY